jgi:hypothetical protein
MAANENPEGAIMELAHGPHLINWLRLEDMLVQACAAEVRAFAADYRGEPLFAFCLEFDALTGELALSYGGRAMIEAAVAEKRDGRRLQYREAELRPRFWGPLRARPHADPDRHWASLRPLLDQHAENMRSDLASEVAEFCWLRFEYLAECVAARLRERRVFQELPREEAFLIFSGHPEETLEELEDRLAKAYPGYRRATAEMVRHARVGQVPPRRCSVADCGLPTQRQELWRCTHCQSWVCAGCRDQHSHDELYRRLPFLSRPGRH